MNIIRRLLLAAALAASAAGERIKAAATQGAALARTVLLGERIALSGVYTVECRGADGVLKWRDTVPNLVTTAGKNFALDTVLAGSAYTAAWYLGLIDATGYSAVAAGDTAASHGGWSEFTGYSNSTRPAPSWGSASAGSKASSATAFNINASGTVKGCHLISNSTKGGTSGTLYSAGLFSGGDKTVASGDTLNVTYTASA
jgi:hypothetical protein